MIFALHCSNKISTSQNIYGRNVYRTHLSRMVIGNSILKYDVQCTIYVHELYYFATKPLSAKIDFLCNIFNVLSLVICSFRIDR